MKEQLMLAIKMNKKITILLFLLPFFTSAQVVSDAQQWTNFSVNKKINNFEFSLGEEIRFDENISHIGKIFTELSAEYKITKGFYASLAYRFSRENDYETINYDMTHRVDVGLKYKLELDKFKFGIKSKIQIKKDLPHENNPTFSRSELSVSYSFDNKLSPFISYEFYYQFNDQHVINKTRFSLGSKYAINDKNAIQVYYLFENKFNVKNLQHNHIFGVSYSIDI